MTKQLKDLAPTQITFNENFAELLAIVLVRADIDGNRTAGLNDIIPWILYAISGDRSDFLRKPTQEEYAVAKKIIQEQIELELMDSFGDDYYMTNKGKVIYRMILDKYEKKFPDVFMRVSE